MPIPVPRAEDAAPANGGQRAEPAPPLFHEIRPGTVAVRSGRRPPPTEGCLWGRHQSATRQLEAHGALEVPAAVVMTPHRGAPGPGPDHHPVRAPRQRGVRRAAGRAGREPLDGRLGLPAPGRASVYHEAYDLNSMGGGDSDLGAAVVAPLDCVVTDVLWWDGVSSGFGNHLAVWIDDARASEGCYLHVAHLDDMCVWPGQRVPAGQLLGTLREDPGGRPTPTAHTALWHAKPPGGWNFWQTGKSQDWVAQHTLDPRRGSGRRSRRRARWRDGRATPAPGGVHDPDRSTAGRRAGRPLGRALGPGAADHALPTAWRQEWTSGRYRGRPVSAEQAIPASEDKPEGRFQVYEAGVRVLAPGRAGEWTGMRPSRLVIMPGPGPHPASWPRSGPGPPERPAQPRGRGPGPATSQALPLGG